MTELCKPVRRETSYYVYDEMVAYVNAKYGVYIDDFSGVHRLPDGSRAQDWFVKWAGEVHGMTLEDLNTMQRTDNSRYATLLLREYESVRCSYEPPYQNFWHFLLDDAGAFGDGANESVHEVEFVYLRDNVATEDWQRKILNMFIAEFGTEPVPVLISW